MDINKLPLADTCMRSGADMLHTTIQTKSVPLGVAVFQDFAELLNSMGAYGATIKEQLPLMRLVGYMRELSGVLSDAEVLGLQLTVRRDTGGNMKASASLDLRPYTVALNKGGSNA